MKIFLLLILCFGFFTNLMAQIPLVMAVEEEYFNGTLNNTATEATHPVLPEERDSVSNQVIVAFKASATTGNQLGNQFVRLINE